MRFLLAIALAFAPELAHAQFGPDGFATHYLSTGPVFSFTAPTAGDWNGLLATTKQTITCARASTATVQGSASTVIPITSGDCAVDYRGLQVEGSSVNLALRSEAFDNASWAKSAGVVVVPTVTADQAVAPDGNTTADQIALPTVVGASAFSEVSQGFTGTAASYTLSVWLKKASGSSTVYLGATPDGATWGRTACSVTTTWARCTMTRTLTAATWFFVLGVDLRDGSQSTQSAQTIFAWGAQAELEPFATSYIPTVGTTVARAADVVNFTKPSNVTISGGTISSSVNATLEGCVGTQAAIGTNQNYMAVLAPCWSQAFVDGFSDTVGGADLLAFADSLKLVSVKYAEKVGSGKAFACAAGTCGTGYTLGAQSAEPTTVYIGGHAGGDQLFGWISTACLDRSLNGCPP